MTTCVLLQMQVIDMAAAGIQPSDDIITSAATFGVAQLDFTWRSCNMCRPPNLSLRGRLHSSDVVTLLGAFAVRLPPAQVAVVAKCGAVSAILHMLEVAAHPRSSVESQLSQIAAV